MTRADLKSLAKRVLEGRRGNYAIFLVILGVITFICSFIANLIPIIGIILSLILGILTTLLVSKFTINLCNSHGTVQFESTIPEISHIWKFGLIQIALTVVISVLAIPFVLLAMSFALNISIVPMIIVTIVFIIIGFVLNTFVIFTPYIVLEDSDISIIDLFMESIKLGMANLGDIIVMQLSFIPWILLIMVTFGFGSLYVMPYMNTTIYLMYKNIKGEPIDFLNKETIF
ncbi:MAG: DUF975 family protein [Sarcina sp.]